MDDLFAPPGNAWQPVSPSLARMRRVVLAVCALLVLAGLAVVTLLASLPVVLWLPVVVVVVALLGYGWVLIGRNARWWGYAERDEDLYIKHGAMFRELVVVPYGRMQYVDVTAGPLDRRLGLARVTLHTAAAASDASIPGLPAAEATRLRDRLAALGEARAAGL